MTRFIVVRFTHGGRPRYSMLNLCEEFKESEYNGKKYLWPSKCRYVCSSKGAYESSLPIEEGKIVLLYGYAAISGKHGYRIIAVMRVKEGSTTKVGPITVENAEPLLTINNVNDKYAELEAEVLNSGFAVSRSKGLSNIAAYMLYRYLKAEEEAKISVETEEELEEAETSRQPQQPQIEIEEEELELEGVETPSVAPAKQQAEEKKQELVRIYLLSMRLPSKYLVQKVKIEKNGGGYVEARDFSDKVRSAVASRLEGIRREAIEKVKRVFCYVEEYGTWIAVTEEAVEEARNISKWVIEEMKKISALYQLRPDVMKNVEERYGVKAIPIYMEPEDAKELLEAAIRHLSADVEELRQKIEEAQKAKKRRSLRDLEEKYEYKRALLEAFRKYLASLG